MITTLMILALLTVIGAAAINTTSFELKIAGNERQANQRFYTADSCWKQSGPYLNALASPPDFVNTTFKAGDAAYDWTDMYYLIVRNYGDGADGILNDLFPDNTEDGSIAANTYWYRLVYENDFQAVGFGANFRDFQYDVRCTAEGSTQVGTNVRKVFQVGY